MKILYAIQGTGNGHLARAVEIIPILQGYADTDILISGHHCELSLPWPVKFQMKGLGFTFGKKGGIDYKKTFSSNSLGTFLKEVRQLPVHDYDLVISDFEPVSAWACKLKGKKCIGISHQSAVLNPHAPKPAKKDWAGELILRHYAPISQSYGFHFKQLGDRISTPVVRHAVRYGNKSNRGHYTVYLPAYADIKIIAFLSKFSEYTWEVFSKHSRQPYLFQNIRVRPVNLEQFTQSLLDAEGVFCTAGFETPAETLFLGKKLCVVPMKGQYEQQCNAAMLKEMGIPVIKSLKDTYTDTFREWLQSTQTVQVSYPDHTQQIIERILEESSSFHIEYFPMAGGFLMPNRN